jgi:hypothetical protein
MRIYIICLQTSSCSLTCTCIKQCLHRSSCRLARGPALFHHALSLGALSQWARCPTFLCGHSKSLCSLAPFKTLLIIQFSLWWMFRHLSSRWTSGRHCTCSQSAYKLQVSRASAYAGHCEKLCRTNQTVEAASTSYFFGCVHIVLTLISC